MVKGHTHACWGGEAGNKARKLCSIGFFPFVGATVINLPTYITQINTWLSSLRHLVVGFTNVLFTTVERTFPLLTTSMQEAHPDPT